MEFDRISVYNDLQDRGDCQSTRKSYKTSHSVGWVVGGKICTRGTCPSEAAFLNTGRCAHPNRFYWREALR